MNALKPPSNSSDSLTVPSKSRTCNGTRDRNLAYIISRALKSKEIPGASSWNPNPVGVRDRAVLLSDRALAAYFLSVAQAGEDGWDEELSRVRAAIRPSLMYMLPELRLGVDISGTVLRFLPAYRTWGTILLQSGADEEVTAQARSAQAAWERLW